MYSGHTTHETRHWWATPIDALARGYAWMFLAIALPPWGLTAWIARRCSVRVQSQTPAHPAVGNCALSTQSAGTDRQNRGFQPISELSPR